ncbi:hypothetical protein K439DRAFT_1511078 [Ramaria rubella]|nr:hypothetical protein K439DRAFT_1511078 [Ramaria rubella]
MSFLYKEDNTVADSHALIVAKIACSDLPAQCDSTGADPANTLLFKCTLRVLDHIVKEFCAVKMPNGIRMMAQIAESLYSPLISHYDSDRLSTLLQASFTAPAILDPLLQGTCEEVVELSHLVFTCCARDYSPDTVYPIRLLVQGIVLFCESLNIWSGKGNLQNMTNMEKWEIEPEEWVNKEEKGGDSWEFELCCCVVLDSLLGLLFLTEAVYCAVGCCANWLNGQLDFDDWLNKHLILKAQDSNPDVEFPGSSANGMWTVCLHFEAPGLGGVAAPCAQSWTKLRPCGAEAGEYYLLKVLLIVTVTRLVEVTQEHSSVIPHIIILLIQESFTPNLKAKYFLDKDGLRLWVAVLKNVLTFESMRSGAPALIDMFPDATLLVLENLDLLGMILTIVMIPQEDKV